MAIQKGRNWSSGDIVTAANLGSIERGVSAVAEEYTPTTWANGDTVTAAALNNIEQGIASVGGSSGDFSTATVTLNDPEEMGYTINGAFIDSDDTIIFPSVLSGARSNLQIVLYKGASIMLFPGNGISNITVSGSATIRGIYVVVTGDCTITIGDGGGEAIAT